MRESINLELIRKKVKRVLIATPAYDGTCKTNYVNGLVNTIDIFIRYGINYSVWFLPNESLIPRARNYCADMIMRDDKFSHLLFIDSDIGFTGMDVLNVLHENSLKDEDNIMCVSYAKKTIAWEKVIDVVNKGIMDGKDPELLSTICADFVLNLPPNTKQLHIKEPIEVMETGTGFMLIPKTVFEKIDIDNPHIKYKPDHSRTKDFDGNREISIYFHCEVDKESKRYLSEDYYFCRLARKSGIKTYIIPWVNLTHMGTNVFSGDMMSMINLGLNLTHGTKLEPERKKIK